MSWEEGRVHLAADAVVFHVDEIDGETLISVLLIQRLWEPFKDRWALPGGGVEWLEDTQEACERELGEETGLIASFEDNSWTALTVRAAPLRDPRGRVVSFPYAIALEGPRPAVQARDDAKAVRWWPLSSVQGDDLAFDHAEIIAEAASLYHFGQLGR